MNILVLSESYPTQNHPYALAYIHSRLVEYLKHDIKVTVLSFSAQKSYVFDGVKVCSEQDVLQQGMNGYELIISHAPNLRNHYRFIKKFAVDKKVVFFIHGHEVLRTKTYYPEKYYWKKSYWRDFVFDVYDILKLKILTFWFYKGIRNNLMSYVFVSDWMKAEFLNNIAIKKEDIECCSAVINNPVNRIFLEKTYMLSNFKADYVTVRPLDDSKYAIDLIVAIANNNPNKTFHVYGKGQFFNFIKKPENITVFDKFIMQSELPELLNTYACALMPTRLDAQGVMVCEMAVYGMPVLTSDIQICKEMLTGFDNVGYLSNENPVLPQVMPFAQTSRNDFSMLRFATKNIVENELAFFRRALEI